MYSINNTSNCCDGKAARPAQQHNQALPLRNVTSVESMRQGNKRGRCETSMGSSSEDDRSLGELHFSKSAKVLFDAESGSEDDISEESESEPDCDLDVLVGRQQRIASFKKPDMSVSEKYLTLLLSMVEPGVSMIHSQQASRLQSLVEYDDIGDNTKKLYITYLRLFKKYCDQIDYGKEECSRYNVTLDKTIGFFRKVMFKRRIKKLLRVSGYKDTAITIWLPTNNKRQEVVLDLNEILKDAPVDEIGRKVLNSPCGKRTMEQALKALVHLHKAQTRLKGFNVINDLRSISDLITEHCRKLVMATLEHEDGGFTDPLGYKVYTVSQHIACLSDTWMQPFDTQSYWLREHLALAIRHSMLLRDKDLRALNLSDLYINIAPHSMGGTQVPIVLTATLHSEKGSPDGKASKACAVRHEDVRRCSVGALGFHFFDRFQYRKELLPDFKDLTWLNIKVLQGPNSDRTVPIPYSTMRHYTMQVFDRQKVQCSHITHSGRQSGIEEARGKQIIGRSLQLGGQGNHDLDEIEVCSSRCDPQKFAFGMAGFIKKPFHLRRNEVEPSLELQRQVFPFIELAFGEPGTPGYDNWMRVCDGEMTELKDVAMRERPDLVDIENEDCDNEGNEGAKCCVSCTSISNDRKISFLKLLLRLRKVILQDVAAYFSKFPGFKSYVMSHPVFAAPEFLRFRGEMARNLERPDASFSKEISPNFLHALTTVSFQQQEMQTRILTNLEKFTNNYQASFQKLMQSNTAFQDTMLDMMQRYQQQMIDLFEKNSWAKQGYCDSCQCPNCIHWRHFSQSPPIIQQNQIRPMAPTSTHVPAPAYEQGRPWTYQGSSTSPPQPYQFASSSSSRPSPSTSSRQAYYQTHSSIIQTDGQSFHFGPVVQSASTIPATCASRPLNLSHKATDIKEDSDSNFNVSYDLKTATDVWNEQQEFERIKTKDRQQNKKSLFLQANCYKQLNNRKRVAEEVHYRIDRALEEASEKGTALSRDTALQYVLSDLDQIMSANRWSVNQLVNYCRDQAGKRNGKGKDIDRESGSGDGPSTSKAFEDQEAKEEDDC